MEHISFNAKSGSLELKKSPVPKPENDEVLVKVAYSGVCGTDLHIIEGAFPCKEDGPITLGHEFVGIIQAVGSSVKDFKIGDRVAVDPNSGCNLCNHCHNGDYHFCLEGGINSTIGIFRNGGWSTHATVPATQVYHLPNDVKMPQAALSEPLSCIAHGWDIINPVNVGEKVLITGAGIIGLLWSCMLHLHGLRKTVTISEPQEKRREICKKLNLDYDIKSPQELKAEEFNLAIDCSGSGPAIEGSIPLLTRGGRLCIFGVANPKTKVSFEPYQMYKKELKFVGANINPFSFPKGLGLLQAMSDTYLQYDNLGIKVYKLSQYKEAINALKEGKISKAVFQMM